MIRLARLLPARTRVLMLIAAMLLAPLSHAAAPAAFDLQRYHGKVVVVDFWASWCKPCRQSIPWLNEMQSRYAAQGLVVVGINVDAVRADADKFMRDTPIRFDIFYDSQGELARRYALQGMPSTLVFGRDGQLVATHIGFQQAKQDAREADLRTLLDKEPG